MRHVPCVMRRHRLLICLAGLLCACGGEPAPQTIHPLAIENRLIKLEIPLAKKTELYTVIDLTRRVIQIKNRGHALRELPVLGVDIHRPWPATVIQLALESKGIAPPPKPTVIIPVKKTQHEEDTGEVVLERLEDSLELEDMPTVYSLEFQGGSRILVLSESAKSERVANISGRVRFGLLRRFSRDASATIRLNPNDARALYWALLPNQLTLLAAQ